MFYFSQTACLFPLQCTELKISKCLFFYLSDFLSWLNVVCTMWFCYLYFLLLYTNNPFRGVCQQGLLMTHTSQHLHWDYLQHLPCQCRLCLSWVIYQFACFFVLMFILDISIHCIFLSHVYMSSFVTCFCLVFAMSFPLFLDPISWCVVLDSMSVGLCLCMGFFLSFFLLFFLSSFLFICFLSFFLSFFFFVYFSFVFFLSSSLSFFSFFLPSFLPSFLPFFLFLSFLCCILEIRHLLSIEVLCAVTGVPGTNRQYRNNTPSSMEADMLYL